jgi:hypothetical protein
MNYLIKCCLLLLTSGCVCLKSKSNSIHEISIAIPKESSANLYWPNNNDVLNFYGKPLLKKDTKYGDVYIYNNVNGCGEMHVFFEEDTDKEYEKLVSSILFKSLEIEEGILRIGDFSHASSASLRPLVIDGHAYKGRYNGMGDGAEIIIKEEIQNTSLIIYW